MASNNRSSGTAAFRYASALVDLALEAGALSQLEQDVKDLQAMLQSSPDLQAFTRSPLVKGEEQQRFLSSLADQAKFSGLTKNFLLVLAQNRRLPELGNILKAIADNMAARRGEIRADVETASGLSAAQKKTLEDNLSQTVGRPVTVDAKVNPNLIGGVVVTMGSLMIDDSIKTKLDRMGRAMKSGAGKAA